MAFSRCFLATISAVRSSAPLGALLAALEPLARDRLEETFCNLTVFLGAPWRLALVFFVAIRNGSREIRLDRIYLEVMTQTPSHCPFG